MMRSVLLSCALFFAASVFAISEKNYPLTFKDKVWPYFTQSESNFVTSFDGVKIHYRHFQKNHSRLIVILPGRTEPTSKYAELVYDLKDLPYDILLIDPRSQGYSERLLPNEPLKGHVRDYADYGRDLELFEQLIFANYRDITLLGHSMGGAIGLAYERHHPGTFTQMILSSPMIEMKTKGMNEKVAFAALGLLSFLGRDEAYIPGGSSSDTPGPFASNRVTSSPPRYEMARGLERNNPSLIMAAATVGWSYEALKMGRAIFSERTQISFPQIILFQAEFDELSHPKRQQVLCEEHPACELVAVKGAKHEMLQERDEIRNKVIQKIKDSLK